MPRFYLVVSIIGLLFTLNALRPVRRPDSLAVPAFFAAWLTAELPYHHLAWQALATAVFIVLGALRGTEGIVGLALTLASWAGLVVLIRRSAITPTVIDKAVRQALGDAADEWPAPEEIAAEERRARRRAVAAPFRVRNAGVTIERGITYAKPDGKALKLDVYRPADERTGCPTLFFIHGGAWILGDKRQQGIPMLMNFASRGWVCVTANYRHSPKVAFPAHLLDVKQALRWIREHGSEYGADPGFVVVTGASAGGHLAALIALTANDPAYQPGFEEVDTRVQGAVLWYGVFDFTNRVKARSRGFLRFIERTVMKQKLRDSPEAFAAASPMDLVRADAPPTLIIQGSNDTLVPPKEARHFAHLLRAVSTAPVAYAELPGAQHAFDIFPAVRTLHAVDGAARFCDYLLATRDLAQR